MWTGIYDVSKGTELWNFTCNSQTEKLKKIYMSTKTPECSSKPFKVRTGNHSRNSVSWWPVENQQDVEGRGRAAAVGNTWIPSWLFVVVMIGKRQVFLPFSPLFLSGLFTCRSLACLFALAVSRCSEVCLLFSALWWLIVWCLHGALFQTGLRPMLIPAEPMQ